MRACNECGKRAETCPHCGAINFLRAFTLKDFAVRQRLL
jgi:RNA polymerase subunit RPABC4/transcription elongation factor Spt4